MRVILSILFILSTALAQAAEPPTVWQQIERGKFVVLSNVVEADDPLIPQITYLYGKCFQPGLNGEPVDLKYLQQKCLEIESPHNIVAIDLEDERVSGLTSWSKDEKQWKAHADLAKEVIAAIREVRPEWKLSWFGRVPNISTRHINGFHAARHDGSRGSRYREWQNAVRLNRFHAAHVAPLLDWYHPSLHLTYWDYEYSFSRPDPWFFSTGKPPNYDWVSPILEAQHTPLDVWMDVASVGLRLTRRTYPRKPIIPAISPQWWIKHQRPGDQRPEPGEYVCERWTVKQLDLLKVRADGAVVAGWPEYAGETKEQFRGSRRWRLIREWAGKQKGERDE